MRAWLFQDSRQKKKLGKEKCPWSVGWLDPDGKRRSKRIGSKSRAEKFRRKIEGELAAGTYEMVKRVFWNDFRSQYESDELSTKAPLTVQEANSALTHFERIVKPKLVRNVNTATIDSFKAKRLRERGRKRGSTVSPATVNKELRHLRAALAKAEKWGYLMKLPLFERLKEPDELPAYVTEKHFTAIIGACDVARHPANIPSVRAADWWRALLVFAYMTGWRIGEILSLRREDVDLEVGTAITRASDNKGSNGVLVRLHAVVVSHLRQIASFEPLVFPWYHHRTTLYNQFASIQQAAGIHLPCPHAGKHECTPKCHVYGFHDERRAFATENAGDLSAEELQRLMRHKSYSTTQRYINMAERLGGQTIDKLHVPAALKDAVGS